MFVYFISLLGWIKSEDNGRSQEVWLFYIVTLHLRITDIPRSMAVTKQARRLIMLCKSQKLIVFYDQILGLASPQVNAWYISPLTT
jgi:hypothetical protein